MRILQGHDGPVRALAYHPDGDLLASGGEDGKVVLWNLPSGKRRGAREGHTDWVRDVAFSPTGRQLASAGWDGRVILWDPTRRRPRQRFGNHDGGAWSVAFSPDGHLLARGAGDGTVRITHATLWAPQGEVRAHTRPVTGVAFGPVDNMLVTAGHDGMVIRWEIGLPIEFRSNTSVPDVWFTRLAMDRNEVRYAACTNEGRILVLAEEGMPEKELNGQLGWFSTISFVPGGPLLSACRDGIVQVWDVPSERVVSAFNWGLGSLYSLAVAPDGMTAAAGGQNGQVVVWDLEE